MTQTVSMSYLSASRPKRVALVIAGVAMIAIGDGGVGVTSTTRNTGGQMVSVDSVMLKLKAIQRLHDIREADFFFIPGDKNSDGNLMCHNLLVRENSYYEITMWPTESQPEPQMQIWRLNYIQGPKTSFDKSSTLKFVDPLDENKYFYTSNNVDQSTNTDIHYILKIREVLDDITLLSINQSIREKYDWRAQLVFRTGPATPNSI